MTKNCEQILCNNDPPITERHRFKRWSLKNHPDKIKNDENIDLKLRKFQEIAECVNQYLPDNTHKLDCHKLDKQPEKLSATIQPKIKPNKKKASCLRKMENWTNIQKHHRFDKSSFNPNQLKEELSHTSPKILQMLKLIQDLDNKDLAKEGRLYKHFIFSDVKEGGYGAKIIASSLLSYGFTHCFQPKKNGYNIIIPPPHDNKYTFGVLSSTALYNTPTNLKTAKEILKIYNNRPNNIYGDNMRFIIFDSGFKEGIDLFDVKYVHIFETPKTSADLTQAVGRATRRCGQNGLDFIPNVGWKLFVYQYKSVYGDNRNILFDTFLQYSGIEMGKLKFRQQLEKLAINSAVDYHLNYQINKYNEIVKKDTNQLITINPVNKMLALVYGGKKTHTGPKTIPCSKYDGIHIEYTRNGEKYCRLKTIFSKPKKTRKKRYKKPHTPKSNSKAIVAYHTPKSKSTKSNSKAIVAYHTPKSKSSKSNSKAIVPYHTSKSKSSKSNSKAIVAYHTPKTNTTPFKIENNMEIVPIINSPNTQEAIHNSISLTSLKFDIEENLDDLEFEEYQQRITTIFDKYKYKPINVENMCNNTDNTNDRLVSFTESQDFISHYFTPNSINKGLLVWHSVGTGKTCTAVSTKSFLFERQDYTILWVTRNTLKEDIWKNMFVWVCDHHIRERIARGETIPENPDSYRKYLMKKFLPPMSYRQFSNAMSKKGALYDKLVQLNGSKDHLKKTLIIIDEAHKLYGKDLVGMEKPNTKAIENSIFNSYQQSGHQSCKVMLMTATPIADDPMEFMCLMNLLIGKPEKRFTTNYNQFLNDYVNKEWEFSEYGKNKFQNTIKGLISYLNRSYDPRQFTQPKFYVVKVPISKSNPDDVQLDNCDLLAQQIYIQMAINQNLFDINIEEEKQQCLDQVYDKYTINEMIEEDRMKQIIEEPDTNKITPIKADEKAKAFVIDEKRYQGLNKTEIKKLEQEHKRLEKQHKRLEKEREKEKMKQQKLIEKEKIKQQQLKIKNKTMGVKHCYQTFKKRKTALKDIISKTKLEKQKCNTKNKKTLKLFKEQSQKLYQQDALESCGIEL